MTTTTRRAPHYSIRIDGAEVTVTSSDALVMQTLDAHLFDESVTRTYRVRGSYVYDVTTDRQVCRALARTGATLSCSPEQLPVLIRAELRRALRQEQRRAEG